MQWIQVVLPYIVIIGGKIAIIIYCIKSLVEIKKQNTDIQKKLDYIIEKKENNDV